MTISRKLHLDVLPPAQKSLWAELASIPDEFTLYGGTAVALYLGHRDSIDFDFFGTKKFDPLLLASSLSLLANAKIIQSEPNTLTALIDRNQGPVKISFFGLPSFPRLRLPYIADNGLKIASLIDLAGTKVSVIQVRAELKDYLDVDAILTSGDLDLATALAAAKRIYGHSFNPQSTLKAMCYFEDGNVSLLGKDVRSRLVKAAKSVNLDKLPELKSLGE
jgi:hypothetical protein